MVKENLRHSKPTVTFNGDYSCRHTLFPIKFFIFFSVPVLDKCGH